MNGYFDSIISLGSNCEIAHQLDFHFLRKESLPFDWLITLKVETVRHLIESHFGDFLDMAHLDEHTPVGKETGRFFDRNNEIYFLHDFLQGCFNEQFDDVVAKYQRKILRFYNILESQNRCLFIRKQTERDSLNACLALGKFLQGINIKSVLWILSFSESQELAIEPVTEGIYHVKMSHLCDQIREFPFSRDWEGNYQHWNALLSNIYLNSDTMKKRFEDDVNDALDKAMTSGKEIVFWGCGGRAEQLLPFFLNRGFLPKVIDKNDKLKINSVYARIAIADVLKGSCRYFIIVTSEIGRDDIASALIQSNYIENIDFCMIPELESIVRS